MNAAIARAYRDHSDDDGYAAGGPPKAEVSERDARIAGQVLHIVMKDLNPGR